jgi:quercetin dioxygenase-like cupin family protein
MEGKFIIANEAEQDQLDWGIINWLSRPATTDANSLTVLEVTVEPGCGHDFHKHPDQEEVIYILDGEVEQYIGMEKRMLKEGDCVFIGPDVIHATFNVSDKPFKTLAILGPCAGEEGYEVIAVAHEEPWASLRL